MGVWKERQVGMILVLVGAGLILCGCNPKDPCESDPCSDIQNAVADSCINSGDGNFTCDCDEGYDWDEGSFECYDLFPCDPDPCSTIQGAVADSRP